MAETIDVTLDGLEGAVTGILEDVRADFGQLSFVDVLIETHRELEAEHKAGFAGAHTPGGDPWKPLSPATVKRKGHAKILVKTGRLRSSLTTQGGDAIREVISEHGPTGQHGLSFGTQVPYAIYHQDGTQKIPQREHVGTNTAFVDKVSEKVADATVRKLRERATARSL